MCFCFHKQTNKKTHLWSSCPSLGSCNHLRPCHPGPRVHPGRLWDQRCNAGRCCPPPHGLWAASVGSHCTAGLPGSPERPLVCRRTRRHRCSWRCPPRGGDRRSPPQSRRRPRGTQIDSVFQQQWRRRFQVSTDKLKGKNTSCNAHSM